ncbi:chaperonin 10-like protein [Paraphoma chrysanthemicola]|uniref:Chaperonin 10-like protein n=1 Tax=Paraphoma chrysanthemicola TaxID=798071 RepID=A0A8K0R9I5_9PLEO|nr:chaperonin 10-like protein [Paraphoma chrysanthemicola]
MSTMRAYTHTARGSPSTVLQPSTLPKPSISSPTHLLIRTMHCALNPGASIFLHLLPFVFRASPAIPELDFAGIVEGIGSDVVDVKVGDEIFGSIPVGQHARTTSGSLAEYIVVERSRVVKKPANTTLSEAAGLGVAGSTALDLVKAAKLKNGDAVLVNGAAGGIGHLVVQICMNKVGPSGRVVAICSRSNVDWVKELGTGVGNGEVWVIDREAEDLVPKLVREYGDERFDVLIDAVGIQEVFDNCPDFLKEGKPYVTVGPKLGDYTYSSMLSMIGATAKNLLWPKILGGTPRPYVQVAAAATQVSMKELAEMVEKGVLKVHVGTLVEWDKTMEAYKKLLSGHAGGKVVVAVGDSENPTHN